MPELSKSAQIAMALAMPASVIVAYWLFSRWSSDEEYYGKKRVATSHTTRIKVSVPSKAVGTIIGKQGSTIKRIQSETGARLHFSERTEENDGKPRVLMVVGTPEMAQQAELMVYQIIAEMPIILTEEIQVPYYCVGRIIGKGGSTVRDLRRASGARIDIDKNSSGPGPDGMKAVALSGSRKEIDVVMELIEEIVKMAEFERQEKDSPKEAYVERERGSIKATAIPVEEDDSWDMSDEEAMMISGAVINGGESCVPLAKDFLQVMVSGVEHPGHFWVQMVGPKSLHLEQIQKDLTQQLVSEDIREELTVTDPKPGDMVAAKFDAEDPVFYRAQVLGVMPDGKVDLYFVDYGDNTYAEIDKLFQLRSEFKDFPHQAIQCLLANVEPLDEKQGWTDEDITLFEDLVYCAQWKLLYAKILTYAKVQGQLGPGEGQETLRPCLQLVDTSNQQDVDIAEELIRQGHARHSSTSHNGHSDTS